MGWHIYRRERNVHEEQISKFINKLKKKQQHTNGLTASGLQAQVSNLRQILLTK